MTGSPIRLRDLPLSLRVGATALILILAGGYCASLYHLWHHVGQKDGRQGLTWDDVVGTYHGVDRPAPMVLALESDLHRDLLSGMNPDHRKILRDWLDLGLRPDGETLVARGYDALPPGAPEEALAPADVIDESCGRCHRPSSAEGGGVGKVVSLANWTTVQDFAYAKRLEPVSVEILATSTHTHALSIPLFTLVAFAMLLGAGGSRPWRYRIMGLCMVGLAVDFAGMWLARWHPGFCGAVVVGGLLYGAGFVTALAWSLGSMWFGRPAAPGR